MEKMATFCDVCGAFIGEDYMDGFWYHDTIGVNELGADLSVDVCSFKCFVEHWGVTKDALEFYHKWLWCDDEPCGDEVSMEGVDMICDEVHLDMWHCYE